MTVLEARERLSTPNFNSTFKKCKKLEVLIQPDPGGRREENSLLDNTIIIAQPTDRISPYVELQEQVKPPITTIVFNEDHTAHLEMVTATQQAFNAVLGVTNEKRILSYNPVFDIVNIKLAATPEQKTAIAKRIETEQDKNLRERYHVAMSVVKYTLDEEGNAYGENCPEPADLVFERGALDRIRLGSEPIRELSTVQGGIEAKRKLAESTTPLHSKMVVISGPGVVKDSVYTDNFVDIYESDLDLVSGKKIIIMTRFASSSSYDEYKTRATRLHPGYFNEATGPIDAYFLANPIFINSETDAREPHELFRQEFAYQKEAMGEDNSQEILRESKPFIDNYIDVVLSKASSMKEIAIAFNAVLNKADAVRKEIIGRGKGLISNFRDLGKSVTRVFRSIKEEVAYLGKQAVVLVMVGCGFSGGFSLGDSSGGILASVGQVISNAIGAIGGFFGFSKDKDYCIRCGACGKEIKCVVRKGGHCPKCRAVRRC